MTFPCKVMLMGERGSALEGGWPGGSAQRTAELAAGSLGLRGARAGVQQAGSRLSCGTFLAVPLSWLPC